MMDWHAVFVIYSFILGCFGANNNGNTPTITYIQSDGGQNIDPATASEIQSQLQSILQVIGEKDATIDVYSVDKNNRVSNQQNSQYDVVEVIEVEEKPRTQYNNIPANNYYPRPPPPPPDDYPPPRHHRRGPPPGHRRGPPPPGHRRGPPPGHRRGPPPPDEFGYESDYDYGPPYGRGPPPRGGHRGRGPPHRDGYEDHHDEHRGPPRDEYEDTPSRGENRGPPSRNRHEDPPRRDEHKDNSPKEEPLPNRGPENIDSATTENTNRGHIYTSRPLTFPTDPTTARYHTPEHQHKDGEVDGYMDTFPVILLKKNEIR